MAILELIEGLESMDLLFTFVVPFIAVFTIIWAGLSLTRIFNNRINGVLALMLVLLLASTEFWVIISNYLIQIGSVVGLGAFIIVFVFGAIIWGLGRGRDIYRQEFPYRQEQEVLKRMGEIDEKIAREHSAHKQMQLVKKKEDLQRRLQIIRARERHY